MGVKGASSPFNPDRLAELRAQYAPEPFDKETLLQDRYLLASEDRYRVFFAALGALPPPETRVVFVGLTPGLSQMQEAARAYADTRVHVRNDIEAYSRVLRHRVAFAGSMRRNLCSMLDALGFPAAFGIHESLQLFDEACEGVAATSALVYPVFVAPDLHNFSGAGIRIERVSIFRMMLEELLAPRLERAPKSLVIPLGVAAASGVQYLCETGVFSHDRVLLGMPHPSGSNGHRKSQFAQNFELMQRRINSWFS